MKQSFLLIFFLFVILNCYSQYKYTTLDSLEISFDTISHTVAIPCEWNMSRKIKTSGKPFFINKDSTRLEFNFFKASSISFLNQKQTAFEKINEYYNWKLKEKNYSNIVFELIEENKEKGFVIFKINDGSGIFYYLLTRNNDPAYSIKIFDNKLPVENQLDHLRLLHKLNKDL